MGCGKTSHGKKLAKKLNFSFIDLDAMVEENTGSKIISIFDTCGEEKFRQAEHECLIETLLRENTVIATGGGTPCFFNNMEMMNNSGVTIYLKINSGIIASRLVRNSRNRPLLKPFKTKKAIQFYVEEQLQNREPFYLKSKVIVEGNNINANKIIGLLDATVNPEKPEYDC